MGPFENYWNLAGLAALPSEIIVTADSAACRSFAWCC